MMSARDQRTETSKIQQNGGTKMMQRQLKGRSFLTLKDFTPEEIGYFRFSSEIKSR